jgi:acetyl-CoA acetyltransferase
MTEACIVGWAHTPFGKLEDPDIESLIGRVAGAAIEDAGISPHDLDAAFVSLFNNGFSAQDFPASLVLQHVRSCGSSRSPATRTPAPPDRLRSMVRGTSCWPVVAALPW